MTPLPDPVLIAGAGPAGLTAAYELSKRGWASVVFEKEQIVGGIARTEQYKGYRFDIGGHRFFTKIREVEEIWREVLKDDFIEVPRLSRIFYNEKFFDYPLKPLNALAGLGLWNSTMVGLSYLHAQLFPQRPEETFEQWVSNRFGRRLFETFFKTYTEKVWGIPCSEIKAEWAAQRIKGLSLFGAIRNALLQGRGNTYQTLIDRFHYPRLGPGMLWNRVRDVVEEKGSRVMKGSEVTAIRHRDFRVIGIVVRCEGAEEFFPGSHLISSMPLPDLISKLEPPAPGDVRYAASQLSFRDFLTVALIVKGENLFPDNWIYVHSPEVLVGRIQNFGNWSAAMVPEPSRSSLGLEYFCTAGDRTWSLPNGELIARGAQELERIGLASASDVVDGTVVRQPKAYPVYSGLYGAHLNTIKAYLTRFSNLETVGRNGLHKYNNQDHSMLTALLAVRNFTEGERNDVWEVNTERSYHEEVQLPRRSQKA